MHVKLCMKIRGIPPNQQMAAVRLKPVGVSFFPLLTEEAVCQSPSLSPARPLSKVSAWLHRRRTRQVCPEDTRPIPGHWPNSPPNPSTQLYQPAVFFSAMATSAKRKQEETHLKMLREMTSLPANRKCFDCDQRGPTYVNMTVGSFVCTTCSGILWVSFWVKVSPVLLVLSTRPFVRSNTDFGGSISSLASVTVRTGNVIVPRSVPPEAAGLGFGLFTALLQCDEICGHIYIYLVWEAVSVAYCLCGEG